MKEISIEKLKDNPQSVIFSASWCKPCQNLKLQFKDVDFPYIYHDSDEKEIDKWLDENNLNVRSYPTVLEYHNNKYSIANMHAHQYLFLIKRNNQMKEYVEFTEIKN